MTGRQTEQLPAVSEGAEARAPVRARSAESAWLRAATAEPSASRVEAGVSTPDPEGKGQGVTVTVVLAALLSLVAVVAFVGILVRPETPYPAAAISAVVYFVILLVVPAARPVTPLLAPRNVCLAVWFLVMVALPAIINVVPPSANTLPYIPPHRTINGAILLNTLAYVAFFVGASCVLSRAGDGSSGTPVGRPIRQRRHPQRSLKGLITGFAAVGIIGVVARVGTVGQALAYFQGRIDGKQLENVSALRGLVAAIGPPFLSFAFVLLIEQLRRSGSLTLSKIALPLVGVIAPVSLYSYNRTAVVVPVIAIFAAYGLLALTSRKALTILVLVGLLVFAYKMGDTRREILATEGGRYSLAEVGLEDEPATSLLETIQVYGQSPQFPAFALESTLPQHYPGQSLVSSALSPIPALGRPYRDSSGDAMYNRAIYGTSDNNDQILPLAVEAWWSLGPPGVLLIFGIFGALLEVVQRRFSRRTSFAGAYGLAVIGVWLSFTPIVSMLVISQLFIYFSLPLLTFKLLAGGARVGRSTWRRRGGADF
ncbi:O-antigen polymerase [Micromonospora sp. IBHARD004]|uniref:O-antigen polymerase n=1 Tax=Micromonospora sp. IBHARD004 TaxID=3457764 RepID=UPI004059F1DA